MWRGRPRAEGMSTNGRCHAETPKPSTVSDRNNSQIVYNRFERFFSFVARFSSCILYFCYFRARDFNENTDCGNYCGQTFTFFSAALLMRLLLPLSSGNVLYLWDGDFFRYIRGFVRGERRTESIEPPQSALFAHNKCYIVFVNVRKLSVRQPEGCYYVAGLNLWCVADDNFAIKNAAIIELGGGGRWGKARRWGLCGADFIRLWRQQRLKCATSYCCLCLFSHCDLGQYVGLAQRGC